ncbi:NDP-hexose 2,3-dehydratase family protein [Streptomyces sp. NPDC007355]|uniref:NDP-hexose 2,3-dehydratase family protein n=1 Tax=Streptomyces sp. NPDC007355 TaxID=3364778 RepID=UPI0036994734
MASARISTRQRSQQAELDAFYEWFGDLGLLHHYHVERVGLGALAGWRRHERTGDLVHASGRFFTITGLRVRMETDREREWTQPVIVQPEIGLLGILVRRVDGVLHCLMQAKMEPGNINTLQMSPTVQATRSNYTGVHRGRSVPYVEYFIGDRRGTVLSDTLQSEQGWWFLHKRNRNMIVEIDEDVPLHDGFRWLSLDLVGDLLRDDNVINMDSRTVLASMPYEDPDAPATALHPLREVLRRLTDTRARHHLVQERVPLDEALDAGWQLTDQGIARPDGRFFEVIGVDVQAERREVGSWSQPLVAPRPGLSGLFVRHVDGVPHLLLHARVEAGTLNVAEYAPSVQWTPDEGSGAGTGHRPPLLDRLLAAPAGDVFYDTVHSEEGGRFHHALTRNLVVAAGADFPDDLPPEYCWVSLHQARVLLQHSNYLNVQARTLVACLNPRLGH